MNPSLHTPIQVPSRIAFGLISATVSAVLLLVGSAAACGPSGTYQPGQGDIGSWPSFEPITGEPIASASPLPIEAVVATRVVVAAAGIDLPIISGDRKVPHQGPDMYPPCDVALYHTSFGQPGEGRTTYLYAHARDGMFLPLLTGAERDGGESLIGARVDVYTSDDRVHVFVITLFKRHSAGFALVDDAPPGAEQLILQTSEGPRGTVPKLQVLALPVRVEDASHRASHPHARPRACYLG